MTIEMTAAHGALVRTSLLYYEFMGVHIGD